MATAEQAPPSGAIDVNRDSSSTNALNKLLARVYSLDWTAIFYVVLFIAAILTRFIGLGDRVMSHDESLHTKYSYDLYKQGIFQHTPLMHGPILFHFVAFFYFLFGDSDFSARMYPAVLGILMVMMPKFLFSKWLGKRGAMIASLLLLISPMVLFHNRYIREDTPSIFYTLLMVWAIFQYIGGERPRQIRWLLILGGAMLMSLGSKEVGFMYIAIFGSFLTLFWLMQVLRGVRTGETAPIVGWVLGGVLGVGILGGVAWLLGGSISDKLFADGGGLLRIGMQAAILLVLAVAAFAFWRPLRQGLTGLGSRAESVFQTVAVGVVLGTVAALIMTVVVNIAIPKAAFDATDPTSSTMLSHLVLWTVMTVVVLLAIVLLTALVGFWQVRRIPWVDLLSVIGITTVVAVGLLFLEERSKNTAAATVSGGNFHNEIILAAWGVAIVAIILLLALRFLTPFFDEMKKYPVFDVLIVMGTLLLPWLGAFPMFAAGYQLDVYPAADVTIQAGVVTEIPFILVGVIAGLCWNPAAWIACAATFYSLFAFFYTTVFTNPPGIISGLVGSLGYWLAQQGVRRGSQPQYYYILVELPIYEFLPVIGAFVAGIVGLTAYWRLRATRYAAAFNRQLADTVALESDSPVGGSLTALNTDIEPPIDQTAFNQPTAEFAQFANETVDHSVQLAESASLAEGGEFVSSPAEELKAVRIQEPLPKWLETLTGTPFLAFVAWWAVLILYAFTVSGEKMPWLTMHLTIPFILVTGWFVGTVLDRVEWPKFFRQGWGLIVLTPILIIAVGNLVGPFLIGNGPFGGLERGQLLDTGVWLAAGIVAALTLYAIFWILSRIGIRQTGRVMLLGVFVLLGVLTARAAWRFAYIDYDYATEFGVYAHGAPSYKVVMGQLETLSKQTTDSMNIKVAYDDLVSWPGSWYFRSFPKASFIGDASGASDLQSYAAILVGQAHSATVEAQLGDRFYKYDYIRLWWPMQDYFNLTPARVDNVFAADDSTVKGSLLRQGLWSIWWNRDYAAYATATGENLDINQWPVADRMDFYVRKDIAAQVWNMGVGGASADTSLITDPFAKLRCTTCAADMVIATKGPNIGQVDHPRAIAVGPEGNLYVADSINNRIQIFDPTGRSLSSFGVPGAGTDKATAPPGALHEPWGVTVGADGWVYVADTWNNRVQVFDASHTFVTTWGHLEQLAPGQAGAADGFWGPRAITVDDQNRVYVSDTGNKRIRIYDRTGKLLSTFGSAGAAPGQLNEPTGLAFDAKTQRLFVADTWNKRIEVFDATGNFVSQWPISAWKGSSEDTGTRPYIALDATGTRLFVDEPDLGQILVWDVSNLNAQGGQIPLLQFGLKGTALDSLHFNILSGLAVDSKGNLYAADSEAGRILRFGPASLPNVTVPPPLNPIQPVTEQPTNSAF